MNIDVNEFLGGKEKFKGTSARDSRSDTNCTKFHWVPGKSVRASEKST